MSGPNWSQSTASYCCTTPAPAYGISNLASEPLFVDRLNGNFRLQSNSPCINAGSNGAVSGTTDLDGRPRIIGGTVDIGAYEYQGPGFSQFIPWLTQFGLPVDGTADFTDPDADGRNNWQEWLAGTDPTNALSVLCLLPLTNSPVGVTVTWPSVPTRSYSLERSTNLGGQPPFQPLVSGLPGQAGTTTFTDTNASSPGPVFYRVGIQP